MKVTDAIAKAEANARKYGIGKWRVLMVRHTALTGGKTLLIQPCSSDRPLADNETLYVTHAGTNVHIHTGEGQ